MRRPVFRTPTETARELFARSPSFELASTTPDGRPVLRTLHGVVLDGALAFHGAPTGEKLEIVGREAVVAVHEVIAALPSYFTDPERACPATTLYESAQAHGVVTQVTEPTRKAAVLQALMTKLQPEGGHAPITADDPRYTPAVRGILILEVRLDEIDGKAKLLQHKGPASRDAIVAALWRRGEPDDALAIERVLAVGDAAQRPAFLRGPADTTLHVALAPGDAAQAADLLADAYWNDIFDHDDLVGAHEGATAWVGAKQGGALVASARAISDGHKHAWIYDVVVRKDQRGRGLGHAVVRLLLDHPRVRRAKRVHLGTRDRTAFYAAMGFVETSTVTRPYRSIDMVLARPR
ncbi:MAG: GNAT family N-acetyltransferase [Deltaproteobacteria bacterium]|nr:GNAT family N-acetyltransferase [Deltaproteobacteria bacterium]